MRKFILYWNNGVKEEIYGKHIANALLNKGYDAEKAKNLWDWSVEGGLGYEWDGRRWKCYSEALM